jgi:hypothetical protein
MSKILKFGMFSEEGNRMVTDLYQKTLNLPLRSTESDIYVFLKKEFSEISEKHPEVMDTDVRERFMGQLEQETERRYSIYFL